MATAMHHLTTLLLSLLLLLAPSTHSHPLSPPDSPPSPPKGLPLIIWHGLGDTYTNPSLTSLAELYTTIYPNTSTYIIRVSSSPSSDRTSTFLGHLPTQLLSVCQTLLSLPPPFTTSRLNLLGLSQGGQFLRALIQTCPLPHPPSTLLTFGSQHTGISKFLPSCAPADFTCRSTSSLLEKSKWTPWAQHNLVPAQYFRDPADLQTYLLHSSFLADINNEREDRRNETYSARLSRLHKLVMYLFAQDKTVVPRESGWFDDIDPETGDRVPLRETRLYREDWLGLRELDEKGGIVFEECEGEHMRLTDDDVITAFKTYFLPPPESELPTPEEEL